MRCAMVIERPGRLLVCAVLISATLIPARGTDVQLRGVARADVSVYSDGVKCIPRDASPSSASTISIPRERVNDNYCDCLGGEDEPGTAACSDGQFWCINSGHKGVPIPHAWVDDGYCDCCDGSDEPAGLCPNTCNEIGREARQAARAEADRILKGVSTRDRYVAESLSATRKDKQRIDEARAELKVLKSKIRASEKLAESLRAAQRQGLAPGAPGGSPSGKTDPEADQELNDEDQAVPEEYEDMGIEDDTFNLEAEAGADWDEAYERDETEQTRNSMKGEGLDMAENPQAGEPDLLQDDFELTTDEHDNHENANIGESSIRAQHTKAVGDGVSPGKGADAAEDYLEMCKDVGSGLSPMMMKIQYYIAAVVSKAHALVPALAPKMQTESIGKNTLDACLSHVTNDLKAQRNREHEVSAELSAAEARIGESYGEDNAMRTLDGTCIRGSFTQYEYELCFFGKVQQFEHGKAIASLGKWGAWKVDKDVGYMEYKNGDACWNGPRRSTRVRITCGVSEEIVSVDEPNRCAYEMVIRSPAACRRELADAVLKDAFGDDHRGVAHDEL